VWSSETQTSEGTKTDVVWSSESLTSEGMKTDVVWSSETLTSEGMKKDVVWSFETLISEGVKTDVVWSSETLTSAYKSERRYNQGDQHIRHENFKSHMRTSWVWQVPRMKLKLVMIIYTYRYSPCLKENTTLHHYKDNWLISFKEIIAVYETLKYKSRFFVTESGTYISHWGLKS
jgi:hypothetical protein